MIDAFKYKYYHLEIGTTVDQAIEILINSPIPIYSEFNNVTIYSTMDENEIRETIING